MKRFTGLLILSLTLCMLFGITSMAAENMEYSPRKISSIEADYDDPNPGDPDVSEVIYIVNITDGWLNVRSSPNTSASVVGRLANGSYFNWSLMQPAGAPSDWLYGSGTDMNTGNTVYGWVYASYLVPGPGTY